MTRLKSPIPWVGGKSRLMDTIIPLFPTHHGYVEVFAGSAWMLFKKEPSKIEVINDINKDLTNMYKVFRHHPQAFIDSFESLLISKDQFDEYLATPVEYLTDIQRAVRFYYLIKTKFRAKLDSTTFESSSIKNPKINFTLLERDIRSAKARLERVTIENRPYDKLIPMMDKPDTFFYIDPPYWNCENDYGKGIFCKNDFTKLHDLLVNLKGKFIMSINDVPEIRSLFAQFKIQEVTTKYSRQDTANKPTVIELLIMNFEPELK